MISYPFYLIDPKTIKHNILIISFYYNLSKIVLIEFSKLQLFINLSVVVFEFLWLTIETIESPKIDFAIDS